MNSSLFITGATGFIGRRVLEHLGRTDPAPGRVRCLVRSRGDLPAWAARHEGDIRKPESYETSLEGVGRIVHLAASTGKAARSHHRDVNLEGTRALLDAAKRRGVGSILFVSTIATTYPDLFRYPYAESKAMAEHAVRQSGLDHTIVRPTIVLGPDAPLAVPLRTLAKKGLVFGNGQNRVQPIHVEDVGRALGDLALMPDRLSGLYDLGGPTVLAMEDLLAAFRTADGLPLRRFRHLPLRLPRRVLWFLERLRLPIPLTAGQLSAFLYDSTAGPAKLPNASSPPLRSIEEMVSLP